ncbi:MAG: ABC transporter permease [Mobilicoccus sp.]|nr:ABC transporter permease [Mobilicoccus sp.]
MTTPQPAGPTSTVRIRRRGIPWTYVRLELLRPLRNPWTIGFALLMPVALYLLFGAGPAYGAEPTPRGTVAGMIMANMALFGSMMAATNVAGSVSDERASGWNRQLRLTPLSPAVYVGAKIAAALLVGLIVVGVTFAVGFATGARLDLPYALAAFAFSWLAGSIMFAAFGLAIGYLFRGEAVLGVVGPFMSLFAFFGGIFIPLDQLGTVMSTVGTYTPMYGLRSLLDVITLDTAVEAVAVAGAIGWTVLFAVIAAWRYRRVAGRE